jgi:hypothetical protein
MTIRRSIPILVLVVCIQSLIGQQATVREEKQVIKTYPFRGPNPSPTRPSGQRVQQRIYPYFSFDELTSKGVDQTWNVVRLENPYVEAFVLPAVGGKLMGAVEKSTNKAFIYYNHVLKFRNIAMRTLDVWRHRVEFRNYRPCSVYCEPCGLPGPQESGRKCELLCGDNGPAVSDRVEGRVPNTAR